MAGNGAFFLDDFGKSQPIFFPIVVQVDIFCMFGQHPINFGPKLRKRESGGEVHRQFGGKLKLHRAFPDLCRGASLGSAKAN